MQQLDNIKMVHPEIFYTVVLLAEPVFGIATYGRDHITLWGEGGGTTVKKTVKRTVTSS